MPHGFGRFRKILCGKFFKYRIRYFLLNIDKL
jgi:hypothetical protein